MKKTRVVLVLLLFAVFLLPISPVDAWKANLGYRRNVTIAGQYGAGTNYQVLVNVSYDSDMQADFDDIRFTAADTTTSLSHWREHYVASQYALFWVKVADSLDTGGNIYLYYGNATFSTASNGVNTFRYFEDFSSDPWSKTGTTVSVSGGKTYAEATTSYGDGEDQMFVLSALEGNFSAHFKARTTNYAASSNIRFGLRNDTGSGWNDENDAVCLQMSGNNQDWDLTVFDNGAKTDSSNIAGSEDTTYLVRITRNNTAAAMGVWSDYWATSVGNVSVAWTPENDPEYLYCATRQYANTDGDFDYVFIRKFVDGDCYVTNIGAEQSQPSGSWHETPDGFLWLDLLSQNIEKGWLVLAGMIMIPASTLYLVWGKRKGLSQDKVFFFLLLFMVGWGLFIGGIAP